MNTATVSQTGHDLGIVAVTLVSALGTGIIFQDLKDTCQGLLHSPISKFFFFWAVCYNILKDRKTSLMGAVILLMVYNLVLIMANKVPPSIKEGFREGRRVTPVLQSS